MIFMAHLQYPHGMASTRRIQHSIDYLMAGGDFHVKVLILRQGRVKLAQTQLSGTHKGVEYVTIGTDIKPGPSALIKGPKYYLDGIAYLRKNYNPQQKNVLYVYGYPSTDNIPMLIAAKTKGYRILFDIVEDITYQKNASDFFAKLKNFSARIFCKTLWMFTDSVLVISKHLHEKITKISKERFEVVMYPISVDFDYFDSTVNRFHDPVQLFYGGTFGEKDGIENLIAAFEKLAARHDNVNLVLTGKGDRKQMEIVLEMLAKSPAREKILYKGYLPDDDYFTELMASDILCMTRTRSSFANAGFPFKLGEYLATARPVIASDVSNIGEYLLDKKNAILIEPDSTDAIAEAMEYLVNNEQQAMTIGAAGRKVAQENFDAKVLGSRLKKLLINL